MKYYSLLFIAIAMLSGCAIRGLNSCYKATMKSGGIHVSFYKDDCCARENMDTILVIQGKQLAACFKHEPKSMVYIWGPNCSSSRCLPLAAVQSYCDAHGYTLYVVSEYYSRDIMLAQMGFLKKPLFSIDHRYYKTNYCRRYCKLFLQDLLSSHNVASQVDHRYFMFERGKPVQSADSLRIR